MGGAGNKEDRYIPLPSNVENLFGPFENALTLPLVILQTDLDYQFLNRCKPAKLDLKGII